MAKAVIKRPDGTRVDVEGTPQEIAKIIQNVEDKGKNSQKEKKQNGSATDYVLQLREEGFFDKPKSLVEIKDKLEEIGVFYPVTSLSGVVLGLTKKRMLGRMEIDKHWKYVKR